MITRRDFVKTVDNEIGAAGSTGRGEHAGETKYAVCTENGVQTPELEPLLPG